MADETTNYARIPTRPLSYENKDLATEKELLVDYKNHQIYISDIEGNIVSPFTQASVEYTATITTTWSGSAAPYTQTISVPGITVDDNPIVDIIPSSEYSTAVNQIDEFSKIYRISTDADSITVYATEKTTIDLAIRLKCI